MIETVPKLNSYDKSLTVVPDKGISVRAVILCSYASGRSTVSNISLCNDVRIAVDCMQRLGADITIEGDTAHIIGAPFRSCAIDCGNSEATARLLIGLLSGLNGVFDVSGDSSLARCSLNRIIDPLKIMGARINDTDGHFPLRIIGSPLGGIEYFMPISSAQVKSALLLAGLNSASTVTVTEKIKTCDHTERMLKQLNGEITYIGNTVRCAGSVLFGNDVTVPGDTSVAAYPLVLALCLGGSCTVKNVGINETRIGFLDVLRKIGARVTISNHNDGIEPCGDITVCGHALRPIIIGARDVPKVIDEIPAICVLACYIDGVSMIECANEHGYRESNVIAATVSALKSLGADIEENADGLVIRGGKKLSFGNIDPCGDSRVAMAAAVAGAAGNGACIENAECVAIDYPSFYAEVIGV